MSKAIVIGSGFAGLSAACHLAKRGHKVTLLEKNPTLGGRARVFEEQGFKFDMGPSWYWMPDVFEHFFDQFGKKPSDYYNLVRLDPSYRVYFEGDEHWDISADLEEIFSLFEKVEPGSGAALRKFLDEGAYKYEVGINDLVYKPGLSLTEFADMRVIRGALQLHLFRNISTYIRRQFKDSRLIQLLEFPVLFLGAMPEDTPALYSLMNYADMVGGTWYPMGGMHKIIEGMVDVARGLGVEIHTGEQVRGFEMVDGKIKRVCTQHGQWDCDLVVSGADYHHTDQQILEPSYRAYTPKYWDNRKLAPSSLIYYLGVEGDLPGLLHHNLFFDAPFHEHAHTIYKSKKWPENPLFYVSNPSKTDPTVAPKGSENIFILIPVAPGLTEEEGVRDRYLEQIMDRMEHRLGYTIRDRIVYKRSYAHKEFIQDYHSFKGNAYGLANTLDQTAILKPKIRSNKVKNLFYTGQLTTPGPGVPPSLISGEVVANVIDEHFEPELA